MIASNAEDSVIDYDALTAQFEDALLDKLRGHGVAQEFLVFWVPDSDPVRGIVSMAESARLAGRQNLDIRVSNALLPAARLPELREKIEQIAIATLASGPTATLIEISEFRAAAFTGEELVETASNAQAAWHPDDRGSNDPGSDPRGRRLHQIGTGDGVTLDDVGAVYRTGMEAVLASIDHEGKLGNGAEGCEDLEAGDANAVLAARIERSDHRVITLRHRASAGSAVRAVMERFCQLGEGLPLLEVADHTGLYTLEALANAGGGSVAAGIVLPVNQPAVFEVPIRLIRKIRADYARLTGHTDTDNHYVQPAGPAWAAMSQAARVDAILEQIENFAAAGNCTQGDILLLRVEPNKSGESVRVVVGFDDAVAVDSKPVQMRRLERYLRAALEPTLELIADTVRDQSPLRRLS